jgi:hypothetical protein
MKRLSTLFYILFSIVMLLALTGRPFAQANLPCTPPPQGIIGWFPGDGNAIDRQGSGYGTLHGGATFTTGGNGKVGDAFSFDGADDRVEIAGAALPALNSSFTFEAWINPASLSTNPVIFQKGSAISLLTRSFCFRRCGRSSEAIHQRRFAGDCGGWSGSDKQCWDAYDRLQHSG